MERLRRIYIKYVGQNILSMIALSGYILIDTYFIAKALGSNGLAALNFSIPVFSIMNGLALMVGIGGATDFSVRKYIEKDHKSSFTHTCILGGIISLILMILGIFFSGHIAVIMGASGEALPLTIIYTKTLLTFTPFFVMNNILLAFIRNDGDPRLPMIAMITSSISNALLDYVFMFIFGWGMFGAVFATCLSPMIGLMITSTHIFRKKNTFLLGRVNIQIKKFRSITAYGFSSFIVEMASAISLTTFNLIILNLVGNIGVGAYGVVANIALITVAIFVGIAQGQQPLASKAFGMGNYKDCNKILKYSWMTTAVVAISIMTLVFLFAENIANLFNGEGNPELLSLATSGLRLYFMGFVFAGFNIISIAYLSAITKTRESMVLSILRSIVILVPVAIIASTLYKMDGVWLSFVLTEAIVFILLIMQLKKSFLQFSQKK